jgi:hypothetical protein
MMSVQLAYKKNEPKRISRLLPIWYENFLTKDCKIWCHMSFLFREGEKLLIQQISCYVPYNIFEMDRLDVKVMFVVSNKISMKFVQYFQWFPSNVKITE